LEGTASSFAEAAGEQAASVASENSIGIFVFAQG